MILDWLITSILVGIVLYLITMTYYYKALLQKEKKNNSITKESIKDAEVVIRKYQVQLQRALGNIDILSDELGKTKADMKALRQRTSQFRIDNDKLRDRIRELESKIEALI